jgi:hypothetical protein
MVYLFPGHYYFSELEKRHNYSRILNLPLQFLTSLKYATKYV